MKFRVRRSDENLGEFDGEEIGAMLEAGKLRPDDTYWNDEANEWLTIASALVDDSPESEVATEPKPATPDVASVPDVIPPAPEPVTAPSSIASDAPIVRPAPGRFRGMPVVLGGMTLLAAGAFWLLNRRAGSTQHDSSVGGTPPSSPAVAFHTGPPALSAEPEASAAATAAPVTTPPAVNPADDLRQAVSRLPHVAGPPWFASYYNTGVEFDPAGTAATIQGEETVVDSQTKGPIRNTKFIVQAVYREASWTYEHYRASSTDLTTLVTTELEADAKSPLPPSIISLLGLKTPGL